MDIILSLIGISKHTSVLEHNAQKNGALWGEWWAALAGPLASAHLVLSVGMHQSW